MRVASHRPGWILAVALGVAWVVAPAAGRDSRWADAWTVGVAAQLEEPEEPSPAELRRLVLEAEDARARSPEGLAPVFEALKSKDNETRRVAARTVGRLEQPALVPTAAQVLFDPTPNVRAEAANALAQLATAGGDLALVVDALQAQLERESHPLVRGVLAHALGRLPYKTVEDIRRAERAIVGVLSASQEAVERAESSQRDLPAERLRFAPPVTLLSGLRGLEALTRLHAKTAPPETATINLARELTTAWRSAVARAEGGPTAEAGARMRVLAMATLVSAGDADEATISTAYGDAEDQVRSLAAQAAAQSEPLQTKLVERAVRDQSPMVRTAVLLALGRRDHASACGYINLLLRDPDPHVAITALDQSGSACAGNPASTAAIAAIARRLPPPALADVSADEETRERGVPTPLGLFFRGGRAPSWHLASHALVALARLAPEQARPLLGTFVSDSRWQPRMYAARAATIVGASDVLTRLAEDAHDNVREAALAGLHTARGHDADGLFLLALERKDYQLLIAAAKALEGTPRRAEAAEALMAAFERISAEERETSRDTRQALLDRLAEVGGPDHAERLADFVRDFDPVVADRVAAVLTTWTGRPVSATPQPLPRLEVPTPADLESLGATRVVVTVKDVGRFEIRPLPLDAPLNAWRFVRLARQGYYDGLTLHRVVPNFVVQGGSPGANEYMGDGPYTRDEVGMQPNARGTIGLSTRGRDTGDAQLFINLVDNMRLDHTYTVFAQIERGVEVIDGILEGDVIDTMAVTMSSR